MTTPTTRPSAQRVDTRKTKAKRDDELDRGVRITVEGEAYEVRVGDVTPDIAREVRARTGMSFMRLMDVLADDPDIDVISAFVWVARAIRGEAVPFESVQVDYAAMLDDGFDIAAADGETTGELDHPEG